MPQSPHSFASGRWQQPAALAFAILFGCAITVAAQNTTGTASATTGSVPSGPATAAVRQLTLQDAIHEGLRYNLAVIDAGENSRIARGQRLVVLSALLPQVSAQVSWASNFRTLPPSSGPLDIAISRQHGTTRSSALNPFVTFAPRGLRSKPRTLRMKTRWMWSRWQSETPISR